jgi:hypothetical protein
MRGEAVSKIASGAASSRRLELGHPPLERAAPDRPVDEVPDLRGREGLGQVVLRPAAHRLYGGIHSGVGSDDNNLQPGPLGEQAGEQVEAAVVPEPEVAEGEVEGLEAERLERCLRVRCLLDLAAEPLEAERERGPDILLIIDDEYAQLGSDGLVGGGRHGDVLILQDAQQGGSDGLRGARCNCAARSLMQDGSLARLMTLANLTQEDPRYPGCLDALRHRGDLEMLAEPENRSGPGSDCSEGCPHSGRQTHGDLHEFGLTSAPAIHGCPASPWRTMAIWKPSRREGLLSVGVRWRLLRVRMLGDVENDAICAKGSVTAACSLVPRISIASLHANYRAFRKPLPGAKLQFTMRFLAGGFADLAKGRSRRMARGMLCRRHALSYEAVRPSSAGNSPQHPTR